MSPRPLKVELVQHGARDEAAKGLVSLLVVALVIGAQWWAYTPEAERRVKLRKLGITQCREKVWHLRRSKPRIDLPLYWPIRWPIQRRCLCAWPLEASLEAQSLADRTESGM